MAVEMGKIEKSAMDTLRNIGYSESDSAIDIINVANKYGFVVGNALLEEDDDGFIIVQEGRDEIMGIKTDKLIGVNSARTLEWKRFIIAHELGHYILHYKEHNLEGLYANRDHKRGHDDSENEIDFFAANLLMPKGLFVKKYNEGKRLDLNGESLVKFLAQHFIVTKPMAERRIEELKLA